MKERTTIIAVLLLGLIAVLGVACSDGDEGAPTGFTPAPAASPTATPTVTPVETPTAAGGEISDELAEQLAEIDRLVSELRGISQPSAVPFEFLDQEGLREFLEEALNETESVEAIELAEKTYKLLGLIDQDPSGTLPRASSRRDKSGATRSRIARSLSTSQAPAPTRASGLPPKSDPRSSRDIDPGYRMDP